MNTLSRLPRKGLHGRCDYLLIRRAASSSTFPNFYLSQFLRSTSLSLLPQNVWQPKAACAFSRFELLPSSSVYVQGHLDAVLSLDVRPDGEAVASCGIDGVIN
eukprot:272237-Pleurochrysis_carterae.AAC.3